MNAVEERSQLARRPALWTALAAAAAFAVLAALLVPWDWVPGGALVPMRPHQLFSTEQILRAEHYSSLAHTLSWASYGVSILVSLVLGLTPLGARLLRRTGHRLRWWLTVPLGTLLLLGIGRLVTLPFGILLHQENLRYGLSRESLPGWGADQAKSLLVSWVMTSILLLVMVGFARWSPRFWFAWAAGIAAVLTVAGSFLYPVLVEPLFNSFTPMHPSPLRASIFRLADKEGVSINDVLVADASRRTTTVNAYVSGIFGTRRVVVYDTLLKDLSPAEVQVVVAHELGHARNNDVLTGTVLGAVGAVVGVSLLALLLDSGVLRRRAGADGAADPAAIALVLALVAVGSFLVAPLQNGMSRAIEARADRASITATHRPQVFIEMQRQIAVRSLSDPTPPWFSQFWFGTHPTALQRAGLPASMARAKQ